MHGEGASDLADGLALLQEALRETLLLGVELAWTAKTHAAHLGGRLTHVGTFADQLALELGAAAKDGHHQLARVGGRVRPRLRERAEPRPGRLDGGLEHAPAAGPFEGVELWIEALVGGGHAGVANVHGRAASEQAGELSFAKVIAKQSAFARDFCKTRCRVSRWPARRLRKTLKFCEGRAASFATVFPF